MAPNATESDIVTVPTQNIVKSDTEPTPSGSGSFVKASRSLATMSIHILIGIVVGANIMFALRSGLPLNSTNMHIIPCVLGFQLMMGESILALAPDSWLSTLRLKHKRLVHWVMQIGGSALALAGCFVKYADKSTHWTTWHGKYALIAMIFTALSLLNGITSLYAHELRRVIPGLVSKLTHILFGIIAFAAASISLAYGIDNRGFKSWATEDFAFYLILMTGIFTFYIIVNPCLTFFRKTTAVFFK